jgi:DegV family protein with EDD domain
MIGIVTDSNSQLPADLVDRYGIEVVPITVTIDGVDYLEGVDLDTDSFYQRFEDATPTVTTSQPSPGAFVEVYERLAERGAESILSIHVTEAMSGTLNSAQLAAGSSKVPVEVVDSGTASFGISCCVWEAAEALRTGADAAEAAAVAATTAAEVETVFIIQALELARAGGRVDIADPSAGAIPLLTYVDNELIVLGEVSSTDEAIDQMADYILRGDDPMRVAIGIADPAAAALWQGLERKVSVAPNVKDVVRYRVGPSVGVHTGPGTAGAFFWPVH